MRRRSRVSATGRSVAFRLGVSLCCALGFLVAFDAPASAATGYSTLLTRAPYLTDLVGQHVAINFATVPSSSTATVLWGAVTDSGCSPTTRVATTKRGITVGTVAEYQWTAQLDLPASGQYCYRPFLGTTDLLGSIPTPTFTTQEPVGSNQPFTFDVMGDWGQVDANGQNPQQAALMSRISSSGARFLMTVGDNGYSSGSQLNYGDLNQVGANTSAIFGPSFWTVPGSHIPIFTAAGNHGLSGTSHTDISTWTQNQVVASSGGRYQNDVYCCVNNTNSANYGSEWYAFSAGNARFYVLDAAWGDTNAGTGTVYSDDAAAHFTPGTPEYTWLVNDLHSHRSQLKFAFFHYPLYSDQTSQPSDTSLDGPQNLEGLLASNGVQMVFNGHAHVYERNLPSAPGMPVSYVTGGGGGTPQPIGSPCTTKDAYGIGWSPTKLKGYACGAAKAPRSSDEFFHFLRVTVNGSTVTVAPTNSLGATFDVQTYSLNPPPATYLDQTPPAMGNSATATFAFHASSPTATFTCSLDHVPATPCTSPLTTAALADGTHAFSVDAADGGQVDPQPATYAWTVDTTAPSVPTGVQATAPSPVEVDLSWTGFARRQWDQRIPAVPQRRGLSAAAGDNHLSGHGQPEHRLLIFGSCGRLGRKRVIELDADLHHDTGPTTAGLRRRFRVGVAGRVVVPRRPGRRVDHSSQRDVRRAGVIGNRGELRQADAAVDLRGWIHAHGVRSGLADRPSKPAACAHFGRHVDRLRLRHGRRPARIPQRHIGNEHGEHGEREQQLLAHARNARKSGQHCQHTNRCRADLARRHPRRRSVQLCHRHRSRPDRPDADR